MTPKVLYHYTSPGGLTGILESSALRATDARFLNDALELKYAWSEFKSTLEERAAEGTQYSEAYRAQLEAMRSANAEDLDLMENRVFSASLTELPDDVPSGEATRQTAAALLLDSILTASKCSPSPTTSTRRQAISFRSVR